MMQEKNTKIKKEDTKTTEISKTGTTISGIKTSVFTELGEILDIVASAKMGIWRIELVEGEAPRMFVDETMKELLGITAQERTPEKTYNDWFSKIKPDAVASVLDSVERMQQGYFDENTYQWIHPTKGVRYVRCGGTAQKIDGGFSLRGYHYDVDEVVRKELEQSEKLKDAIYDKNEYYTTLNSLGGIFYSMHVIDLVDDTVIEFNSRNQVKEIVNHKQGAIEMMIQVMTAVTTDAYMESALEFTDLSTLANRMKDRKIISRQLLGKNVGWILASFIAMEQDAEGKPTRVICTTRVIDDEKKQEEKLISKSQTDELTGFLNRRAYEEDIHAIKDITEQDNFVYVSLDVNGLKVVNDTNGHAAGDELLIGACQCMKKCLGSYGKLYRTGGDEFVAILFCNEDMMVDIFADFEEETAEWTGKLVDGLSVSYGYISRKEAPELSINELAVKADERMYETKDAHYKKIGFDRRGQKEAHKALCNLYTKILKVNITDDTYQIVNMDIEEQTEEKGFSESISAWLSGFGRSGQVHPEDLEEYLKYTDLQYMRDYFAEDKTSLHIFYRRRCEDKFKQVMMEIIPASDYSADNQSLFLYVKNIDR